MIPDKNAIAAGQAVYSPSILKLYDFIVLTISNRFAWKCATHKQLAHYNQFISNHHLDVGVGSGYYLRYCQFPSKTPKVTLMDLNPNCLRYCEDRLKHLSPTLMQADVFHLPEVFENQFDSIALNYVFHCLPGNFSEKEIVIKALKAHLNENGVLFGATILGVGAKQNWLASKLMALYNKKRVFSNQQDDLASLTEILESHFTDVNIRVIGMVALFSARHKR